MFGYLANPLSLYTATYGEHSIRSLTQEIAEEYLADIIKALDQIPLVEPHNRESVLADSKDGAHFYGKWHHSLISFYRSEFAGVIIGSERPAEPNSHRPFDSIYVNSFAVAAPHRGQGLGQVLLKHWIEYNCKQGMIFLGGKTRLTLQTNSAVWNRSVQKLYERAGFKQIDLKPYDNRTDIVYLLEV